MQPWDCETGDEARTGACALTERERARERLQLRRDFGSHIVAYVVVNTLLIGIWTVTGAGYFWPAWVLGFWGAWPGPPRLGGLRAPANHGR
jgi:2TM domain